MTTQEILTTLQADIHSTVFATLDTHGLPQTCVIDLMLADAAGLYFLTVRGKAFYTRLTAKPFVAFTGMKGRDTLSTLAISLRGAVRSIGKERLAEIFEKNPYMAKIYPTEKAVTRWKSFGFTKARGSILTWGSFLPIASAFPLAAGPHGKADTASIRTSVSAVRGAASSVRRAVSALRFPAASTPRTVSIAATATASVRLGRWSGATGKPFAEAGRTRCDNRHFG